jgi:hypothetical protein
MSVNGELDLKKKALHEDMCLGSALSDVAIADIGIS